MNKILWTQNVFVKFYEMKEDELNKIMIKCKHTLKQLPLSLTDI